MIKKILTLFPYLRRYLGNFAGRYILAGYGKIITVTIPKKYVKLLMSKNNFKLGPLLTISFDCDLEEDYEYLSKVLKVLGRHDIDACFAVIGKFVEKYPNLHRDILEEGHEIINHTYTHPNNPKFNPNKRFENLNYEKQKEEIKKCHQACKNILDYEPMGFRSPHFQRIVSYSILDELDYYYSSSTKAAKMKRFGLPEKMGSVIEFPLTPSLKYPFSPLATSAMRNSYYSIDEYLKIFNKTLEFGEKYNSYLNFYFDPLDVGKDNLLEKILSEIREKRIKILPYMKILEEINRSQIQED